MRGKILTYDFAGRGGYISGDDGTRYVFSLNDWGGTASPATGQTVDFEVDGDRAKSIYKLGNDNPLAGDKNKIVAALLAFFLGVFGVHKFYLGKNTAGIIMLLVTLFSWILLFIPLFVISVIAFIEAVIYLVTPEDEFQRKYIEGDKSWF